MIRRTGYTQRVDSEARIRFAEIATEPASLWIRHAPTRWAGPEGWWLDLARVQLASPLLQDASDLSFESQTFQDLVYLPPVRPEGEPARKKVIERCIADEIPMLAQLRLGDGAPEAGATIVYDLTQQLLERRVEELSSLPEGAWAVWPLLPGLTDDEELIDAGLELLAGAGASGVHAMTPALSAGQRRLLSSFAPASSYAEIFRLDAPSTALFAKRAALLGLGVCIDRPPLGGAWRVPNRELAGHFATLGELCLRTGQAEGRAQEFFRAARWLGREKADLIEFAKRGNLRTVEWLGVECKEEVRRLAAGMPSLLLREFRDRYLGIEHPEGGV